jgi:acyl carrier protein
VTTIERLRALLVRDFDLAPASLTEDATLEGLEIDSLRMIEIVFCIEDEFAVTAPSEAAALHGLKTFGDLAAFVDALVAAKPA